MRSLLQDVRFAVRTLLKAPGYSIAALLVMALGIGANTSLFTVVNAVLLRPLPFEKPEQLVRVWHTPPQSSFPGMKIFSVSAANYLDWEKQSQVFSEMSIASHLELNLTGNGQPESLPGLAVSKNYFSLLQSKPFLGRTFTADEDQPGKNHSVVLGYEVWKSHFGADRNIVGKQITLNNEAYDVVGVMSPEFRLPAYAKVWTPLGMTPQEASVRGEHHYTVVARLKPGVTVQQAQAELDTISNRLAVQYPADDKGWGAVVIPLREAIVGDVKPTLLVLLGAVVFVLLIACANVANLTLVRTLARNKEIAIRTALGATRRRVIQQVLAESILLAFCGSLIGIAISQFGTKLIVNVLASQLPRFHEISLDWTVLTFTFVIALMTGLLSGLLPAWRSTQANPNDALKQGLGRTDSDSGPDRTRNVLVVAEVALSLVLLFGAGLMIRTLWALHGVNPGFDTKNALVGHLQVPRTKFATPEQQWAFYDRLVARIRQLPGVEQAGTIDSLPTEGGSMQPISIEGRPVVAMADQPEVAIRMISPGYRAAMRIQMVRGRDIQDSDNQHAADVAVISQAMAKRFWPGEDPIGKHVTLTFFGDHPREVVGIYGDVKQSGLDTQEDDATLYFPATQMKLPAEHPWHSFGLSFVVRSASSPENLTPAVISAIHEIDPELPVEDVMSLDNMLGESIAQQRFAMLLLEAFAGLALVLAAVGIYSVLAYSVRRRLREIGIRMALGAVPSQVLRMIVLEGLRPTIFGVVVGVVASLLVGRLLKSVIFGVKSTDVATFAAVSLTLIVVSVLASALPGLRAMRVQPMKTLREE